MTASSKTAGRSSAPSHDSCHVGFRQDNATGARKKVVFIIPNDSCYKFVLFNITSLVTATSLKKSHASLQAPSVFEAESKHSRLVALVIGMRLVCWCILMYTVWHCFSYKCKFSIAIAQLEALRESTSWFVADRGSCGWLRILLIFSSENLKFTSEGSWHW